MEAARLALTGLEDEHVEPFRGACPGCGAEVLALDVDGVEVVVEVVEVLEEHACPSCAQVAGRGHVRSDCSRCGKSGRLGEALPLRGVAVDALGVARLFVGERGEGEAVHFFHACRSSTHSGLVALYSAVYPIPTKGARRAHAEPEAADA